MKILTTILLLICAVWIIAHVTFSGHLQINEHSKERTIVGSYTTRIDDYRVVMTPVYEREDKKDYWMFWAADIYCDTTLVETMAHGNTNPDTCLFYVKQVIEKLNF